MRCCCLILLALLLSASAARGQAVTAPFARPLPTEQSDKYDDELSKMADILGSLHYLYNLCAPAAPSSAVPANMQWRTAMEQLLSALRSDAKQSARLAAAFNRSYQALADGYANCAPSASEALARYRQEGQDLSRKILENFSGDSSAEDK